MKKILTLLFFLILTNDLLANELELDYKVFSLDGKINNVPVFNSNSPEIIKTDGILLSTFPPDNMLYPNAHLNYSFKGEFDIFSHHISKQEDNDKDLYQAILIKNPNDKEVKIKIKSSASYVSQPDSPFIKLEKLKDNFDGNIYSGPGDRVAQDIIRNKNFLKRTYTIKPNEYLLLFEKKINTSDLEPPYINGRSTLIKLYSSDNIYVADLALFEKKFLGFKLKPNLQDWINILEKGNLAEKRDKIPSPLDTVLPKGTPFIYGRVAGVQIGNEWFGILKNDFLNLNIPEKGKSFAYVLNTLYNNTLSTGQNQNAKLVRRYKDTAYQAHANYGVNYNIRIPLYNNTNQEQRIYISFDSPIRIPENIRNVDKLKFNLMPPDKINFRGELKLEYELNNKRIIDYVHIVQRFTEKGEPILKLILKPYEKKVIDISYIYPADCTPPHVLSISNIE
ncbi:MAG: hypothetical protein KatS3mg068_1084 [Candidatus Sericytochromatia bacterium]|nr:MAG: hypothetical protein KatS3mg068_1084 [Candidatus Sericytochromatia bacterium]